MAKAKKEVVINHNMHSYKIGASAAALLVMGMFAWFLFRATVSVAVNEYWDYETKPLYEVCREMGGVYRGTLTEDGVLETSCHIGEGIK